jgi:enoyl-CoA hydratase/carnithine racemase
VTVRFEVGDDAVGVVTLARPERLNALDEDGFAQLASAAGAAAAAAATRRVRAVLVAGEGRAFCSGLDVTMFGGQAAHPPDDAWIAGLQSAFTALEELQVPTVAALHGPVLGAGLQLALACHLRLAARDAELGLLETRWAIIPDLGATYRLPRLVGLSRAIDLAVTARTIDAATAFAWGLVDGLLDGDDAGGEARAYAARLAAGPTLATGALPGLMRTALTATREDALAAERVAQARCLASEDFREAIRAARGNETPAFRGR